MATYEELEKGLSELRENNFNFMVREVGFRKILSSALLRNAVIYHNNIGRLEDTHEKEKLYQELDMIMANKFKELNSNFSENIIKNMLLCYRRGMVQYPLDIMVIQDAVFIKEGIYGDFGDIYKIRTFMFDYSDALYFDIINGFYFEFDEDECLFLPSHFDLLLSTEELMNVSKIISENINEVLRPLYNCRVTKPTYELNTDTVHYGYKGLSYGDISRINIYLNRNFNGIAKSIINKEESDIKMCVQDGDDISLYNFHQSFENNKPICSAVKLDEPVWKLSEEAMKKENNNVKKKIKELEG